MGLNLCIHKTTLPVKVLPNNGVTPGRTSCRGEKTHERKEKTIVHAWGMESRLLSLTSYTPIYPSPWKITDFSIESIPVGRPSKPLCTFDPYLARIIVNWGSGDHLHYQTWTSQFWQASIRDCIVSSSFSFTNKWCDRSIEIKWYSS